MKYKIRDITPREMACGFVSMCPAIYELTPKNMSCGITPVCPAIFGTDEEIYLIVGEKVNPEEFGLAKKVGANEVLIRVPKKLIDEVGK